MRSGRAADLLGGQCSRGRAEAVRCGYLQAPIRPPDSDNHPRSLHEGKCTAIHAAQHAGQPGLPEAANLALAIPRHCDRPAKALEPPIGPTPAPCSNPGGQPRPSPRCMPLPPAGAAGKAIGTSLLAASRLLQLRSSPAAAAARAVATRLGAGSRVALAPRRHCSSSAMGQKSLDAFFKRPASAQGSKDASTAAAVAAGTGDAAQPAAEPVAGVPPLPPAAAAAAAGGGSSAATVEDTHAAQASEQQRMRAAANRNAALAKQVRCAGVCPVQRPAPRGPSCMRRRCRRSMVASWPRLARQHRRQLRALPAAGGAACGAGGRAAAPGGPSGGAQLAHGAGGGERQAILARPGVWQGQCCCFLARSLPAAAC